MTETQLLAFIMTEHAKHHKEISSRQIAYLRDLVIDIIGVLNAPGETSVPPLGAPITRPAQAE